MANAGTMEALLARHWPELLALGTAIGILLLRVLGNLPSPKRISADPDEAKRLLRRYPSGDTVSAIYLYLTALRLLRLNPIVRAWYASRVTRG